MLEDMKQKGIPIPPEFQDIPKDAPKTFADFLQSIPLNSSGGKRKTRKHRGKTCRGGMRNSQRIVNCLLFLVQYYIFGEVFQAAKQTIPTNLESILNRDKLRFSSTDAYTALLSGLLLSLMVNLAMVMRSEPTIPANSGKIEVIVNNMNKTGGGKATNLYELLMEQMTTIYSLQMDKVHSILVGVLKSLHDPRIVEAIEASLGPMDKVIQELSKPVSGTLGSLGPSATIQVGGSYKEYILPMIAFTILFIIGGGKYLFTQMQEASIQNYANLSAGRNIHKLYTLPWIGDVYASDTDKYIFFLVGLFFFYAGITGFLINLPLPPLNDDEFIENEEELPQRPPVPPLPQLPLNEEFNGMNQANINRINQINRNFRRGVITRRIRIPTEATSQMSYEPIARNTPMVNFQNEMGRYQRYYNWNSFKQYINTRRQYNRHPKNPTTKQNINTAKLVPYIAGNEHEKIE